MINNQIQSPVTGKNSVISGQGAEESKREAGKQQGGLFKLLMSSMQGGDHTGKKGNSSAANILGGNLTLNTSKEGEGKQSALQLLAGSGEGSKEEKITLSKLLEGSGSTDKSTAGSTSTSTDESTSGSTDKSTSDSTDESKSGPTEELTTGSTVESSTDSTDELPTESIAESTSDEVSNEELNAEVTTVSDENLSEADSEKVVSEEVSAEGGQETDSETADLPADVAQEIAPETQSNVEGNLAQAESNIEGRSAKAKSNVEGPESAQMVGHNTHATGEQATTTGQVAAQQQAAALPSEVVSATSTSGSQVSNVQATAGDTKESNPLNGLIADKETSGNGKQTGVGAQFTGEKVVEGEGLAEGRGRGNGNSDVRPELTKSEGLVKELRALAAAQGEQLMAGQQQRRLPTEQLNEATDSGASENGALIQEIFSALQNGSIEQVAAEIRSLKASQLRETRYSNYMSSFANRQEISNSGSSLSSGSGSSTSSAAAGSTATMMPVSAMVPTGASVSSEMFDENGAVLWKEQITEYFESNEKSAAENQAAAAFARLGDVPVTNISVRRSFAQGISQAIMNATGDGKKGSEVWQKHNFVLEDGKNVQVSAREVEGVLHLKLSSSYNELNKLLMDHENEIRDLLENELELKIDLQMDGGGNGNEAGLFGGSTGQQSGSDNGPLDLGSLKKTKEQTVDEVVPKAVRKFGYNEMEWTV